MQYIYASRNALLDGNPVSVAQTFVCATLLLKAIEWFKDRNLRVFAAIVNTKSHNGSGSEILNSYGALRTFMQNNPLMIRIRH